MALLACVASAAPAAAAAEVDPFLAGQLAGALPAEQIVVMVHGTSAESARRAVARSGLHTLQDWDLIATVLAVGSARPLGGQRCG